MRDSLLADTIIGIDQEIITSIRIKRRTTVFNNFSDQDDMNNIASDAIHSYIKDGYRIDAAESVVDSNIDKGCTFKAVLNKNENDIEYIATIKLFDDKNKSQVSHKVEITVSATKTDKITTVSSSKNSNECSDEDYLEQLLDEINDSKENDEFQPSYGNLNDYIKIKSDEANLKEQCNSNNKSDDDMEDYLINLVRRILEK